MRTKFRTLAVTLMTALCMTLFCVPAFAMSEEPAQSTTSPAEATTPADAETGTSSNPFTPNGTGTVVDNATDEDGKAATGQTQLGKLTGMMDGWSEEDSADALLQHMKESWELSDDLSDEDSRSLCGLLYELWLRRKGVTWSTYV